MAPVTTRPRKVTLADVARYAGVSSAVVSYVVNDGPRPVAAETAARVREAIEVLGYRLNTHARALMTGSTGILGLIHPGTANPFFGEYGDVLYEEAAEAEVALLTASSRGRAETERSLIESLADRNVDGIISVTSMTKADIPKIRNPRIPLLFLNCPFPVPGYRTIGPNSFDGARQVVDHLLTVHDHEQVALVAGSTDAREPEERELGWREAHRVLGRPEGAVIHTPYTLDGGYEATAALLDRPDRPSAIFVVSDLQAFGALHAIHDRGLRVADDVAVVSFDGTSGAAHTWPPLTLAKQPLHAMATAAISGILAGEEPAHTLIDMELVVRGSCGCSPP